MSRKSAKNAAADAGENEDAVVPPEVVVEDSSSSGSPIYALGMIGALVWFWKQASDDPADRAMAVLKAIVWPAILVHDAFEALSSD